MTLWSTKNILYTLHYGCRALSSGRALYGVKSRWVAPTYMALKKRHDKLVESGKLPVDKRSEYIEWNYASELYAFGKRLHEEFDGELLQEAMRDSSHVAKLLMQREELGADVSQFNLKDNAELSKTGASLISRYCSNFVRCYLPFLPEEGVKSITGYLTSDKTLSTVGYGIGLKDLVLTQEYPPSEETMAKALKSVVGVTLLTSGKDAANLFVRDFVVTQMSGLDLFDIWEIKHPMKVLTDILQRSSGVEPEPRIIFETGENTIQALYQVGVYADKEFIGSGYGESIPIAVDQAALDCLRRLFQLDNVLLPFNEETGKVSEKSTNISVSEWTVDTTKNIVSC